MTVALWTGVRAWLLGAALYVPEAWLTPEARQRAKIPPAIRFQEKWRLALTLLRQARAAGFQITGVLGDAEFGDNSTLRRTLHRLTLPYALGISSTLTVFRGTPTVAVPARRRANAQHPTRLQVTDGSHPEAVRTIAARMPARAWRPCHVAQRDAPPLGRALRGAARHTRDRVARASAGARGLAALRTRSRPHAPHQSLFRRAAAHRLAARLGPPGASTLGDSNSNIKS